MSMYDADWVQTRIDKLITRIEDYEDAVAAFDNIEMQQYTIDTGQSRQVVTRADLPRLNELIGSLYNQLSTMEQRRNAGATRHGSIAF